MYKIAIIEDSKEDLQYLCDLLSRYQNSTGTEFEIYSFENAIPFLNNYQALYDIIFLDIQLPYMDGMTAAQKLRAVDSQTLLVFITAVSSLAVKGYEVSAFDYLVKPVKRSDFILKMDRVIHYLANAQESKFIISSQRQTVVLPVRTIYYVEVFNHQLIYHTEQGTFPAYGTLATVNKALCNQGFFLCNKMYLINLHHVKKIDKNSVFVGPAELQVSHARRKPLLDALNQYIGG